MSLTSEQYLGIRATIDNAKIGGKSTIIPIAGATIGVTAAAYTSGVALGTGNPVAIECLLSPNGTGVLQTITIGDTAKQSGAIDVLVFNDVPTGTFTNNSAVAVSATDIPKFIGHVSIVSSDYAAFNATSAATKSNIGMVLKNLSTTDANKAKIWLVFVSRDTKTYTANCISANIGILQD